MTYDSREDSYDLFSEEDLDAPHHVIDPRHPRPVEDTRKQSRQRQRQRPEEPISEESLADSELES